MEFKTTPQIEKEQVNQPSKGAKILGCIVAIAIMSLLSIPGILLGLGIGYYIWG